MASRACKGDSLEIGGKALQVGVAQFPDERFLQVAHNTFHRTFILLDRVKPFAGHKRMNVPSHVHPLGSSQAFCRSLEPLRHSAPFGTDPTARDDVSGLPFAPASALDSRASPHLPEDFDDSTARSNSATRASTSSIRFATGFVLLPQRGLRFVPIPRVALPGDVAIEDRGEGVLGPDNLAANLQARGLQRVLKLALPGRGMTHVE